MARYAITIFLSAFLLFQVQPLIGKLILPWFGGSPAVWTTCMLFFQVVLLAGYSYAHLLSSKLSIAAQRVTHVALLAVSLWFLPIARGAADWKPTDGEMPVERILALLAATIGLPYFLLSSTGPLLQESFRRETLRTPYRLYSLSNIGSLLALLTYPFLFEPQLTLHVQIVCWSVGYALFVLCCGWCAMLFRADAGAKSDSAAPAVAVERPKLADGLLWLSLAACGSVMLLATTNQLCQEISAIPFLWVLPLAIYLLTFIICFDHERWYQRIAFLLLLVVAIMLVCLAMTLGHDLGMWWQLIVYSGTLFVCCMVCHGELATTKPTPRYATWFYLIVSAGGALGGILVAIVAPLVLHDFWEYHLGLGATVSLAFLSTFMHSPEDPRAKMLARGSAIVGVGLIVALAIVAVGEFHSQGNLETDRNFYGVLRVNEVEYIGSENGPRRELIHGQTQHGFQYLDAEKRHWPTSYYGQASGIGRAIDDHPRRHSEAGDGSLRIGVVGLGCGTLAAYGKEGDTICFYEINPEVIRLSDEYFTYRQDTPADVEIVLGDARMNMERERADQRPRQFDVLAIDAFSSDSIPMHLLTEQCVELYRYHLKPDGLLCVHISNRFLDLRGVVFGIAQAVDCRCEFIESLRDSSLGVSYSDWGIVTVNTEFLDNAKTQEWITPWDPAKEHPVVWTDDYGSLWQMLRRGGEDGDNPWQLWRSHRN